MEINIVNQLNFESSRIEQTIFDSLEKEEILSKNINKVEFYSKLNFSDAVKKVAPYLKVALFCRQKTFLSIGKEFLDRLKVLNNKTVCYVVPDDFEFSVSNACGVFNLNEDVRAVLVLEHDLYNMALYFATIREIGTIFVSDCLYPEIFSAKIFVPNGQTIDSFNVNAERHVVLSDFDHFKNIAYSIATQFCVYEFLAFDYINNCTSNTDLYDYLETEKEKISITSLFRIYYLNLLKSGVIFENSSLTEFLMLCNKTPNVNILLRLIEKLLKDLKNKQTKEILDYNKLALKIHKLTGEKTISLVSKIKKQLKLIEEKKEALICAEKRFLSELTCFMKDVKKMDCLQDLHLKEYQKELNPIYSVAGYSLGLNAFTLIKEKIYK